MPFTILSTALLMGAAPPLFSAIKPVLENIEQWAYKTLPVKHPDVAQLIELRYRKIISLERYLGYMADLGYERKKANWMLDGARPIMDINTLVHAKWRGIINDDEYVTNYENLGYLKETADNIEKTTKFYPNPQDFISFMVRETFQPDIVTKYGYDADYPAAINDFVLEAGLDPEWMAHFWRAHWQLPSVQQGYEMMHRGVITQDELADLLKVADIPLFWREKLIAISFSPYTRVDIRRMHKTGVLTEADVLRSYMDIGYDTDKAQTLTEFTLRLNLEEPKTIAEAKVKEAYFRAEIKASEALVMLEGLGYDYDGARFITALWDADIAENIISDEIATIESDYVYGTIDETVLTSRIQALSIPTEARERVIFQIVNRKRRMKQLPTKSDLARWFNQQIIDKKKYTEMMGDLGYGEMFIENYSQELELGGSDKFRVPTKADIRDWYKKKIITVKEWYDMMFALGYSDANIGRYAQFDGIEL